MSAASTPSRRPHLEDGVHLLFCQQCEIYLFSCCNIDFHMFIFIPECNCFTSLIVKYHIKIYVLRSLRFWSPPVFCLLSSPEPCTSPLDWFQFRLPSAAGSELGLLGESRSFPLCLLVWLHHEIHSHGRVSIQSGGFVPNWASVSEREADWLTNLFPLHKSEIETSGFSRHLVQERPVYHQKQR